MSILIVFIEECVMIRYISPTSQKTFHKTTLSGLRKFLATDEKVEGYPNLLKLSCGTFACTSYKDFPNNKKGFGSSFFASFSA